MSKPEHTPGPWTVRSDGELFAIASENGWIATMDGEVVNTDRANAHLIAAAPDLLYALQVISEQTAWYERGPDREDRYSCEFCKQSHRYYTEIKHTDFCVMTCVSQAIAKADGEQP